MPVAVEDAVVFMDKQSILPRNTKGSRRFLAQNAMYGPVPTDVMLPWTATATRLP